MGALGGVVKCETPIVNETLDVAIGVTPEVALTVCVVVTVVPLPPETVTVVPLPPETVVVLVTVFEPVEVPAK
jgi:hypothetical protein